MTDDKQRDLLAAVIARGEAIATEYDMTTLNHRDLGREHSARGESHRRTAEAFRNKADGAWAVVYAAREIAADSSTVPEQPWETVLADDERTDH